jgi:glycosyltransferase involved in cell wall biosynthesis
MLLSKASALQHPAEGLGRMSLPETAPSVSVVIPVRNEAKNLPWLFGRMPLGVSQVVIVDGGSHDGTLEVARELCPQATVVTQSRRGKGNALVCGFAAATGEIVVMLDADGSAHPSEIVRFVLTLMDGAEFAKGSRFLPGGGSSDITRLRRLGNYLLSGLVNRLFNTNYSDLCYGYNAFWRGCVPLFSLPDVAGHEEQVGDGFEIETLINLRAARSPLVVTEVPSYESERLHGVSNLNAVTDGLRVLGVVVSERFRSNSAVPISRVRKVPRPPAVRPEVSVVTGANGTLGKPKTRSVLAPPPVRHGTLNVAQPTRSAAWVTVPAQEIPS